MRHHACAFLAPLTALVVCLSPLNAQESNGRAVRGTVVHAESGAPLNGATILLLDSPSAAPITVPAAFRLHLPAGDVRVAVAHVGFAPDTVVIGAADTSVDVRLHLAPVELVPIIVAAERSYSAAASRSIREVDIQLRPRASSQELLRLAPGLVIAQHAGGGKAEQIFMRGFDADHGTDVAISVDGLPVNMVSHAHGQGYADLHFLMPELVERIEVRKGPYDVRDGDFATAGAVLFHTRDRLPQPVVEARTGSFGTVHALAMTPLGHAGEPAGGYVAASGLRTDGPFELSQRHRRMNTMARWSAPLGEASGWFAQLSAFGADWDASGQVPERAVAAGSISRFGAIDATEGGRTSRVDLSGGMRSAPGAAATWEAKAYLTRYDFRLFSNFTFFLSDSVNGDGIEQVDGRWLAGLRTSREQANTVLGRAGRMRVGADVRADRAELDLFHQAERQRLATRVDVRVGQVNGSVWAAQDAQLSPRLRASAGLRGDVFHFRVDDRLTGVASDLPHASGSAWRGIVSPRASLAFDAGRATSLFLNGGGGFHSNDARDVILAGGETVLPRAWGAEAGVRRTTERATLAASVWALDLESELVYVGDEGVTEPSGRTRRIGADAEARVRVVHWLWADADVNLSRGRARDEPSGADRIPLAPEITATGGLTARDAGPVQGGVRFRHIGSRPADETNTVRAQGYTVWELFGSTKIGRVEATMAVDNLFDVAWNEAQFATTSRLRREPEAVTELHFTPGAPRSLQVGLRYAF